MIIPVRCFTCGNVLADKYSYYLAKVRQLKADGADVADDTTFSSISRLTYLSGKTPEKTPEGHVMDELGLHKQCCRRHFLTHPQFG